MSKLTHHQGSIPKKEWRRAIVSWILVTIPYAFGWLLTFPMGLLVAYTARKQTEHPQGKNIQSFHSESYIADGSSGEWFYWNSTVKLCKWWNNYEDGVLGEPSGKHSARCDGKERSFINKYLWTIRNPFNWGKRTLPLFHCKVNDCDIEYWGDYEVTDKEVTDDAWHFCKATDRNSGRVYYWYRSVKSVSDTQVRQASIGFKIKPSHATEIQDSDDEDKAFTIRLPVKTTID